MTTDERVAYVRMIMAQLGDMALEDRNACITGILYEMVINLRYCGYRRDELEQLYSNAVSICWEKLPTLPGLDVPPGATLQ